MSEKTIFLKEQALTHANKCMRTNVSKEWNMSQEPYSIAVRKALVLKKFFDNMPLFIGENEMIVGTRTLYKAKPENEDGHDVSGYFPWSPVPYVTEEEVKLFGGDCSQENQGHYVPDFSILLKKGICGILQEVEERKKDVSLGKIQIDFLESVRISYVGFQNLIRRYSQYAKELAKSVLDEEEQVRLERIAGTCWKISSAKPENFLEAVQLLWFGHIGTMVESYGGVSFGRLDVILSEFLKNTPEEEAQQILECLLVKMYDMVDLKVANFGHVGAELIVTLGGVLPDGSNAVSKVTMLFLKALENVRLPEPEFNLRINTCNPPEYLEQAAKLTVFGYNNLSYYNDDLFVDSMIKAGIPAEYARSYGFDLCQDITIPGSADFYEAPSPSLSHELMQLLLQKDDFADFDLLYQTYKRVVADKLRQGLERMNWEQKQFFLYRDESYEEFFKKVKEKGRAICWDGRSPMCPLPFMSALFHGTLEHALDIIYEPYPIKEKGIVLLTATEAINSLAAIKMIVYDTKQYSLKQVVDGCKHNFREDGEEIMRRVLWNAPKWGNDDNYVDAIGKDLLEFMFKETILYRTISGGKILAGVHQPNPIEDGKRLMATPEGRHAGQPIAVTLTPESGTINCGPTAVLQSAAKIEPTLVHWNFCVMVNYYASVFQGNEGKDIFLKLLKGYFAKGGLQHQPNVLDVQVLKDAQRHPEKYRDLIVRLWGVSAHFIDLPKESQDEMIARFM